MHACKQPPVCFWHDVFIVYFLACNAIRYSRLTLNFPIPDLFSGISPEFLLSGGRYLDTKVRVLVCSLLLGYDYSYAV